MAFDIDTDYAQVGGRLISNGPNGYLDFGWIPPQNRGEPLNAADHNAQATMPRFGIQGSTAYPKEKRACLFDLWKDPLVVQALGFAYPGTHQLTGSCVGAGGGNVQFTLIAVEVVRLADPEKIELPFWLLTYGRSRYHCGSRGPGEGSLGSCFAKAAVEDGVVSQKTDGLPQPTNSDALVWGRDVEMKWSAGDRAPCTEWLDRSRKHLTKTTARCKSADEVREALVNGYPCTAASMYAHNGGTVQGTPAALVARKQGQWAHQMSVQGWWEHPELGELFWLHNQWGLRAHGQDPAGGPGGGVWITKADMDWICRDEVFAFSQFNGFPANVIPWDQRYI